MIGMRMSQAKAGFFDRAAVMNATSRAERKVLSRFGAFVRQRARTSMKRRKGPSPPGKPPGVQVGLLKQHLYFAWDGVRRSVVIGPARLNQKVGEVPATLEYGGPTVVVRRGQARRVVIAPRPYMAPAFAAEQKSLPPLWRNSIR
jgi:hypothetical protein